jgi:sugar (pentulose or hexulose) kinase
MTYALGIELGSSRIKATLIDEYHLPVATGVHAWENRFEDGVWTYHLDEVWTGIQDALNDLIGQVSAAGVSLSDIDAIGISGMMHGYLVFDHDGEQLTGFRTWRNTSTAQAADELTELFAFNIPQRWSIAHLYQAMLNEEDHVDDISFLTTLAGYVHWKLTGNKCVGIGEASGIFPIREGGYDLRLIERFDALNTRYPFKLAVILPTVLSAGEDAGNLTEEGALLLDPAGRIAAGIALCPPEGDAGTGMVATNSIAPRTGNVATGTSVFAMIVLEHELKDVHPELDIVTTPTGSFVAMVHCNNCSSDIDAWVRLFAEVASDSEPDLYGRLYRKALEGEADCGGVVTCNYVSGEHTTGFDEGRPLVARMPDAQLTLGNLMRSMLFSSLATLRMGLDILRQTENVSVERLLGHGGVFKTEGVMQRLMAAALAVPVAVMDTAGEGGSWGMALLAAYMTHRQDDETLEAYLANRVFNAAEFSCVEPDRADEEGFSTYLKRFKDLLEVERSAVKHLR